MRKIYLDLDRTLFQTEQMRELWKTIHQLYPLVDIAQAYDERKKYYRYTQNGYYHDVFVQLQAYKLDPHEVFDRLRSIYKESNSLLFPGAVELIKQLQAKDTVRVLTYGEHRYQCAKASLCAVLDDVEVITTLEHKGKVLSDVGRCYLVDDRPLGDELPPNVRFVQVALENEIAAPAGGWPLFNSLYQVSDYFSADE